MSKIRMGFIGSGQAAQDVYLPLLSQMPQVEPLVLCDSHEAALYGAGGKFGIRETTTRYEDVLKMQEVDAVLIAVPNYLHARLAVEALRAGKHVLCEKPIGITVRDALAVRAAAEETGLVYMMALPHRFDGDCRLLKRWLQAGHLGHVFHVRAGMVRRQNPFVGWFTDRERSGGGALMQLGSHLLDLILWFLDAAGVERVSAARHGRPSPATGAVHDVEDAAVAFLRMSGGRTAVLETAWSLHCHEDREYLEIYGDRAGATLWPLRLYQDMEGVPVDVRPRLAPSQSYQAMAHHFVECALGRGRNPSVQPVGSAEDGVRLAVLTHFLYESAETRREVEVTDAASVVSLSR